MFEGFVNFDFESIAKIGISIALGALIGYERELKHRPAGFRTHMLVTLGSTLFTICSVSFDVEPARIAAGIVAGIGFLGAGNIIAHKGHVKGITSAATMWVVAGIGLLVGLGLYPIAILSAILVFVILHLGKIDKSDSEKTDKLDSEPI